MVQTGDTFSVDPNNSGFLIVFWHDDADPSEFGFEYWIDATPLYDEDGNVVEVVVEEEPEVIVVAEPETTDTSETEESGGIG